MKHFRSSVADAIVRWHDLPGHGAPVVFIHGLGCASSYEYPRVVMDAEYHQRRSLLIDLPGSGYSDKPDAYAYTIHEQACVVVELLTHLQIDACYIYGHSMGGSIAIDVAQQFGCRVLALAVSEPNFYAGGGMFSRQIAQQSESAFINEGYSQQVAAEHSPWAGCLQSTAPVALWREASSLVAGTSPSWMSRFLGLECRKALIFGARSLPDNDVDKVAHANIPVHIIADAGHSMSWENPSSLAKTLNMIFAARADKLSPRAASGMA